jgi:hypothetical protein
MCYWSVSSGRNECAKKASEARDVKRTSMERLCRSRKYRIGAGESETINLSMGAMRSGPIFRQGCRRIGNTNAGCRATRGHWPFPIFLKQTVSYEAKIGEDQMYACRAKRCRGNRKNIANGLKDDEGQDKRKIDRSRSSRHGWEIDII